MNETGAYSEATKTHYESWEALVEAEANGWVAVAIIKDGKQEWPWIIGPFETKREASNARTRSRNAWKREQQERPTGQIARFFVRPAWKPDR